MNARTLNRIDHIAVTVVMGPWDLFSNLRWAIDRRVRAFQEMF